MYIIKKYNIKCYLYIPDDILELHCKWTNLGLSYIFDNDNFKDKLIYKLPNNIIYSCDLEYYDTYENIQRANIGKITYKNVINISNGDKFRNTLIYEVYRLEDTK